MKTLHKSLIAIAVLGGVAASAFGVAQLKPNEHIASKEAPVTTGNLAVIATVNGTAIRQEDLLPLMQNGLDKTNALDRRISQVVLAQQAESKYANEAKAAIESVKNDVLAQIYVSKRSEALKSEITDKDISEFYEKNVTSDLFRQMKVKFKLFADAKEAQTFYELLAAKKNDRATADAIAKLEYLSKQGDHFAAIQELPYNMGQVFKDKKNGDVLQPAVIREGVLVSMLEEVRQQERPGIDKLKEQIRMQILSSKIDDEVQALRKTAKIE